MVQHVLVDKAAIRVVTPPEINNMDQQLPEWARRSNPIVRRHLGAYWKTLLPDFSFIVRLFLVQAVFVIASYVAPMLFTILMPTVTVSLVLLPGALILYLHSLFMIGTLSATSMVDERRKETLPLMLIIPRPLLHVLYSKVSAAVWRQIENVGLVWIAVVLFSMPLLIIQYDVLISMDDNPVLMRAGLILALLSALMRVLLEPIMIGALGVLMGATMWARVPAVVGTGMIAGAYFFGVNLLRLLPLDPVMRLFVDTVLPVILPIVITVGAFRLAAWALRQD